FDINRTIDTFVHDRLTGATERISVTTDGEERAGDSYGTPGLSGDGSIVAFTSDATLVPGDGNAERDVFVRDRGAPLGVAGLRADRSGSTVEVTGRASFAGALAEASDPTGDGLPAGADLRSVSIAYRPQRGDLLVRWVPTEMPTLRGPGGLGTAFEVRGGTVPTAAAGPAYELRVTSGGRSYVIRVDAAGASLLHCEAACARPVPLDGSFGTTGVAATAEVPLSFLGARPGETLSALHATAGAAAQATADDVSLGSMLLAEPNVDVGLTFAGTPPDEVTFHRAELDLGAFRGSAALDASGPHDVWARACLGDTCHATRTTLDP
ncbi:MAG TPA: hypothetical protein VM638_03395, partial [Actinomycetota bacterium]|nr:hypothetical protein [Actinomycetota bacterium]